MIYSDEQDTAKVAKVILCDVSSRGLLSRFPALGVSEGRSWQGWAVDGSAAEAGEGPLGFGVTLLGGLAVPARRLGLVLRHAPAVRVPQAKEELRWEVALVGSLVE